MDEQLSLPPTGNQIVRLTAYVRHERTLVLSAVRRGVGGPGSGCWAGGWHLDLGSSALSRVAPEARIFYLMQAMQEGSALRTMTPESQQAWMRTWKPDDRL